MIFIAFDDCDAIISQHACHFTSKAHFIKNEQKILLIFCVIPQTDDQESLPLTQPPL